MFKTHKENIPQIKAVIDAFGKCYFHGDGNLYDNKKDSDFRKNFTNPGHNGSTPPSAYRVHFTSMDEVPATVEELNKKLQESYSNEIIESAKPTAITNVKTVKVAKAENVPEPADVNPTGEPTAEPTPNQETGKKKAK